MIKARKRFGQNFLVDQGLIGKIIRSFDTRPGEQVIEIGPGQGALTEHLVNTGCDLTLVEIDRDLANLLTERFPDVHFRCIALTGRRLRLSIVHRNAQSSILKPVQEGTPIRRQVPARDASKRRYARGRESRFCG